MISGPRSTGPSGGSIWSRWRDSFGETHLTLDAVVAHVDGELAPGPAQRAAEHVERCLLCAGEVAQQRRTRGRLRRADTPGAPSDLLSALRAIPAEAELPPPPAGLAADPDGRFVVPTEPTDDDPDGPGGHGDVRATARGARRRAALPVAVASGLALGAVALSALPATPPSGARTMTPGAPAGVSGASVWTRTAPTASAGLAVNPATPTTTTTTPAAGSPTPTPTSAPAAPTPGVPPTPGPAGAPVGGP